MSDYLEHHGVKGMQWGVRNYQNPDGSLTAKGRQHYDVGDGRGGRNAISPRAMIYKRVVAKGHDTPNGLYKRDGQKAQLEANRKAQAKLDSRNIKNKARIDARNAKAERRLAISNKTNELYGAASKLEKFIYNRKTYEKMAKEIIDKNTPYSEAVKIGKKAAWRNTAIILGAYGALNAAILLKQNHDINMERQAFQAMIDAYASRYM